MMERWLPLNASAHGAQIDGALSWVHWLMAILFVGWISFFVIALWRFRRARNPVANYTGVTSHAYGPYEGDSGPDLTVAIHNDFPTRPVWITEIGYRVGETVVDGRTPVRVTETVQAQRMRQSLMDFMSWPWAWAYVWFKWADYGDDKMWGVVRADRSHRPAFRTYQTFITASHP